MGNYGLPSMAMVDGMMGGGMMWGMGFSGLLILLGLGAVALIRHLFFSDKRRQAPARNR